MLHDKVQKELSFLFDHGFVMSEEDDWTTILVCRELIIRVTHDRADWFVDVGFSFLPEKWYKLWDILLLLNNKHILAQKFKPTNKFSGVRSALKLSIKEIMHVDEYREDIQALQS
ncbi:MAG: hypothetical protein EOM20_10825 [Spartobacteria bacterium]|nr:hypothetical protein [Spartobacteria bacterium]